MCKISYTNAQKQNCAELQLIWQQESFAFAAAVAVLAVQGGPKVTPHSLIHELIA